MRQSWRDLLFLHYPCDPEEIAPLLPEGVQPDTFPDEDGVERAWIGLVPFLMTGVRWAFAPPVPGTHTFPETNVRTYVRFEGGGPGVWFLSLDAANRLAAAIGRAAFALPYFPSRMSIQKNDGRILYVGARRGADYRIEIAPGAPLPKPEPGSLEFFLVERYLLYAARGDRLWSGRVFHRPYDLRNVEVLGCEETLVRAAGLHPQPFVHRVFSDGPDVEIFSLRRVR